MKRARSKSAAHGNDPEMKPLWQALYAAGADVVINGNNHDYDRFAPQDPHGNPDSQRGICEFVVGTDGKHSPRTFGKIRANSEIRQADT
jgi:hypothetical protein